MTIVGLLTKTSIFMPANPKLETDVILDTFYPNVEQVMDIKYPFFPMSLQEKIFSLIHETREIA